MIGMRETRIGMMGMRVVRVGMQGTWVGTREIGVGMRGI